MNNNRERKGLQIKRRLQSEKTVVPCGSQGAGHSTGGAEAARKKGANVNTYPYTHSPERCLYIEQVAVKTVTLIWGEGRNPVQLSAQTP